MATATAVAKEKVAGAARWSLRLIPCLFAAWPAVVVGAERRAECGRKGAVCSGEGCHRRAGRYDLF